mmetsp:Transcript_12964/g.39194  ORF Transcript_12964/g.39194 Transcript_12964/m.39194 type:complete len:395 (-) Transcript_12964:57-1241(-)
MRARAGEDEPSDSGGCDFEPRSSSSTDDDADPPSLAKQLSSSSVFSSSSQSADSSVSDADDHTTGSDHGTEQEKSLSSHEVAVTLVGNSDAPATKNEVPEERKEPKSEAEKDTDHVSVTMEVEMESSEVVPPAQAFECPICICEVEPADGFAFQSCRHAYCRDCLREYYEVNFSSGVLDLKCPNPECHQRIMDYEIHHVVSEEVFQKYKKFLFNRQMQDTPNCKWCPMCESPTIGDPDSPTVLCQRCAYTYCFQCSGKHDPATVTCQQHHDESEFYKWAKKRTKPCPKCGVLEEKNKGCNLIRCANCRSHWCYVCGNLAEADHYSSGPCKGKDGHSTRLNACICVMVIFLLLVFPLWCFCCIGYHCYRRFHPKAKKAGFKYTGEERAEHVVELP